MSLITVDSFQSWPYNLAMPRAIPLDQPKACTKCGIIKPLSEFYPRGNRPSPQSRCKECSNKATIAWQQANPEKVRAIQDKFRRLHKDDTSYLKTQREYYERIHAADIAAGIKTCADCKQTLALTEFYPMRRGIPFLQRVCKECAKRRNYQYGRDRYFRLRDAVLAAYGGQCACCGENEPKFLAIDHINNDGNRERMSNGKRRSSMALYGWLHKNGYPKDRYQLLCHNCNLGKHLNAGVCPHQERK